MHIIALGLNSQNLTFGGDFNGSFKNFVANAHGERRASARQISVCDVQRGAGGSHIRSNQCCLNTSTTQPEIHPPACPPTDLDRLIRAQGTQSLSACRGCQVEASHQMVLDIDNRLYVRRFESFSRYSSARFDRFAVGIGCGEIVIWDCCAQKPSERAQVPVFAAG